MKKIVFTLIVFAFIANVSAQLKVDSLGNVGIGGNINLESATNTIRSANNNPITFKVYDSSAGFTGNWENNNVSFGYLALCGQSTAGSANTAMGFNALTFNTTGSTNTAIGFNTLSSNTNGGGNTAIGYNALFQNSNGNFNTVTGCYAFNGKLGGSYNTVAGAYALLGIFTGSYNTAMGTFVNFESNVDNATIIGYEAQATSSNQVVIGNNSVTSAKIGAFWSITSDGRTKKNVQDNVPGLAFINRLQPITYNLDLNALDELQKSDDPQINAFRDSIRMAFTPEERKIEAKSRADKEKEVYSGFMAQDVEKAARSIGYNFNGVDAPAGNGKGAYGLRYAEFVVPLVKAVQELSAKNDAKDATISSMQEQINELTELVNKLLGKDAESSSLRSGSSESSTTGLTELNNLHASLEQNVPNPFHHATVIHYTLPETCTSAKILIVNTAGSAVRQIPLSIADGTNSITIHGGTLHEGVYLYSLICDGKTVDTKRMILTK